MGRSLVPSEDETFAALAAIRSYKTTDTWRPAPPGRKSVMKKFIATLVLLAGAGFAVASATEPAPSITVTGQGKVLYVPDMGYIHVGVSSDGVTAAEAWQKNEAVVKKIFAALKDLGLEEKDFKTTNLNVQPRYLHKKDEAPKFLGYTVTYDLVVTVRKLDQMGALLDRMVDAGANRNMSISFGCSNRDELMDQARAKAVAEARKRANMYVTGASPSARLGDVLAISDSPSQFQGQMFPIDAQLVREGKASLPIAAGEQEIRVSVTIRWAINNHQVEPRTALEGTVTEPTTEAILIEATK
jgi:uncharacterized protein